MTAFEILTIALLSSYLSTSWLLCQSYTLSDLGPMCRSSYWVLVIFQALWIEMGFHLHAQASAQWMLFFLSLLALLPIGSVMAWSVLEDWRPRSYQPLMLFAAIAVVVSYYFTLGSGMTFNWMLHTLMADVLCAILLMMVVLTGWVLLKSHYLRRRRSMASLSWLPSSLPLQRLEQGVFYASCMACLSMTLVGVSGYFLGGSTAMGLQKWLAIALLWALLMGLFCGQYYRAWRGWPVTLSTWASLLLSCWVYITS